jgi:hypothetical protein
LSGLNEGGPGCNEAGDLVREWFFGDQIDMQPVLPDLGLGHVHEVQGRAKASWVTGLELTRIALSNVIVERRGPEVGETLRFGAIDD